MSTYSVCLHCEQVNRVPLDGAANRTPVCGQCKRELPIHDGVNEVSASALSALVQKSPLPVVTDFWAPWCQPCRVFAPIFSRGARELAGRAVFAKIDTQAHPKAGEHYQVRGIPTLIVFEQGRERTRQSGAMPWEAFSRWVEHVLAASARSAASG